MFEYLSTPEEPNHKEIESDVFDGVYTEEKPENKIKQLQKDLERITGVAIHNEKLLLDAVKRIIDLEDKKSDGGIMTIKNSPCYQDIVSILTVNGYFVTIHIDDDNNGDTLTIEFWRA